MLEILDKVFWFTTEFGLIREAGGIRMLGSGLIAAPSESRSCLQSAHVRRRSFQVQRILEISIEREHAPYELFVLENLQQIETLLCGMEEALHIQYGLNWSGWEQRADCEGIQERERLAARKLSRLVTVGRVPDGTGLWPSS